MRMINIHFNPVLRIPLVYLSIIENILSGKYLFINRVISDNGRLSLIKFIILNAISIIAIAKTNEEYLLNDVATRNNKTTNIIKSIYILSLTL